MCCTGTQHKKATKNTNTSHHLYTLYIQFFPNIRFDETTPSKAAKIAFPENPMYLPLTNSKVGYWVPRSESIVRSLRPTTFSRPALAMLCVLGQSINGGLSLLPSTFGNQLVV